MNIDGYDYRFTGFAFSHRPRDWFFGWAEAVDDNRVRIGEKWLGFGPLALCFE